jgi:hypothetical protein
MANVDIRLRYKSIAWFNAHPGTILKAGQTCFLEGGTRYKIGNGITTLIALVWNDADFELKTNKNISGGYVGLTGWRVNFRNLLNTFTSLFENSNTASRTYNFPDADGTVALTSNLLYLWTSVTGTQTGVNTFTFSGTSAQALMIIDSLVTCTDSAGTTRRIGYISAATEAAGTITVTVVIDSDLAAGDKDFKIAFNQKARFYEHLISIPGEITADASNPQGLWYLNLKYNSYLLPVDINVRTAATGVTGSCTTNIYKDVTALFNVAPDLTTTAGLTAQRPTTITLTAGEDISLRIPASAGTTLAADYQARLIIVPQSLFTAF